MNTDSQFDITIKPSYKKFYSDESNFGIYTAEILPDSPNRDKIKGINEYFSDITLVGSMPQLESSNIYMATVEEKVHKDYGIQYEVKTIYRKPFTTRDEQVMFLSSVLTSFQIESITNAYSSNEDLIKLIKEDNIDLSLVKGVGKKTLEKIKDKIISNEKYQMAIVELTGKYGISYNAVKNLSDKYGSPDTLLQKVKSNPYILTEVDGFGFKKVDEIALSMGIEKNSIHRIKSCIEFILNSQSNEGHCWVKETKLISEAIKLTGLKIDDIRSVILDESEKRRFHVENGKVYLKAFYEYEDSISSHIKRLLSCKSGYTSTTSSFANKIESIENEQGFKFTEEQLRAIHYAVENNVLIINGKAGTGKTSVIKGIVNVLNSLSKLEYATCALSGKASQRIQESTGLDSYTIHRLLGFNPRTGWEFDEHNKLGQDVIILDEASMVNSQLFSYLIRAIKDGAKLIITGDTAQLEPIGVGNVLVDLLNSDSVPSVELTIVHRQAQKSGILSCANMVREGDVFFPNNDYANKRLGELKDLYFYPYQNGEKTYNAVLSIASKFNENIMDFQVLAPMKNRGKLSTKNLNKELQIIFNKDPDLVDDKWKIERKDVTFLEGDKVIINGNNYEKEVFNGTMGIIEYIDSTTDKGEIVINFDGVGRINFTKEELIQIDLGYAITIHKSQGSQWKYVVLAFDYASYVLLNKQTAYTGMTRAINALFMTVELKALKHAISTDKSIKRNTFLCDLLRAK